MKKILLLYFTCLLCQTTYSQSYYASVDKPKAKTIVARYDGSKNYLGKKVYFYMGQTLMLKCDAEKESESDSYILGFTTDYKIGKDKYGAIHPEKYHLSKNEIGTDYHCIANNLFEVIDIYGHPWAKHSVVNNEYNNIYYLKLYNLTLKDTAYYEYIAEDKDRYFPFIVMEHYSYLKNIHIGQFYQVNGTQEEYVEAEDYKTHENVKIFGKSWCKCINVIINKNNCELSLVLENNKRRVVVSLLTIKYRFKKV